MSSCIAEAEGECMKIEMTLKEHKVAALKHARKRVVSDERRGICSGIIDYHSINAGKTTATACEYLLDYINKSLGKAAWLEEWLYDKGLIGKYTTRAEDKKIKATRLAWIDWMIACYEYGNTK